MYGRYFKSVGFTLSKQMFFRIVCSNVLLNLCLNYYLIGKILQYIFIIYIHLQKAYYLRKTNLVLDFFTSVQYDKINFKKLSTCFGASFHKISTHVEFS